MLHMHVTSCFCVLVWLQRRQLLIKLSDQDACKMHSTELCVCGAVCVCYGAAGGSLWRATGVEQGVDENIDGTKGRFKVRQMIYIRAQQLA